MNKYIFFTFMGPCEKYVLYSFDSLSCETSDEMARLMHLIPSVLFMATTGPPIRYARASNLINHLCGVSQY